MQSSKSTKKLVVLDTNVVIAAGLAPNSKCAYVLNYCFEHCTVLVSHDTLEEAKRALLYKKFAKSISPIWRFWFIELITNLGVVIKVTEIVNLCRDPDDNMFLELALAGKADYLITGDEDLLVLKEFKGTKIMTAAEFLELQK